MVLLRQQHYGGQVDWWIADARCWMLDAGWSLVSVIGWSQVNLSSLSPATAAVAVGMTDPPPSGALPPSLKLWRAGRRTGSPLTHDRATRKNCSLINTRNDWRKCVWRKVLETEWLTNSVDVNGVGKSSGGGLKILDSTFASCWKSTKDFFRRVRSCL